MFINLGYPKYILLEVLSSAKRCFYTNQNKDTQNKHILILPASLPNAKNIIPKTIRTVTRMTQNTKRFLNNTKLCQNNRDSCVYSIECHSCDEVYFGETDDLKRRLYHHRYALEKGDMNSSLFLHRLNCNHKIDVSKFNIIEKCSDVNKRQLLESFLISSQNNFNIKKPDNIDDFTKFLLAKHSRYKYFLKK